MRWGVRDEATDDHSTSAICLEEIRNCQQISAGPNFLVRYIWVNPFVRKAYTSGHYGIGQRNTFG